MNKNALYEKLIQIIEPKKVSIDEAVLYCYACDVSYVEHMPDAVVRPDTKDEIVRLMKFCYDNGVPLTPRGAGTGASAGAVPVKGGILLDLTKMNRIIEVLVEDLQVTVEPGVIHADLNKILKKYGFRFPVKPGSSEMCTIGGMVANNASGMNAVKYGTTRNYVLALEVVLPNGTVANFGGRTLKDVSSYDLCSLYTGSEGTLGIITLITLKILPIPNTIGVLIASFSSLEDAGKAVSSTFQAQVIPSAIEVLDKSAIIAINKYRPGINLPDVEAILLFETDGYLPCIQKEMEIIQVTCKKHNAVDIKMTNNDAEREKLWEARSIIGAASNRLLQGYSRVYLGEDITVPISKIPNALLKLRELSEKYGIPIITFGHIGDGNLHPALTIRKYEKDDWERVLKLTDEIHEMSLALEGTVSGEHGVGVVRAKYLKTHAPQVLKLMRSIKKAIDPKNIMNPGKMALEDENFD